jgi:uracil-DNA glycosylase family 4
MKQCDLFDFLPDTPQGASDPLEILREISVNCKSCRLGQTTDKQNNGFSYSGNPANARVAVIGDMPQVEGTMLSTRPPIAGEQFRELNSWLMAVGIPEEDVFLANVVQCKTTKSKAKDAEIRPPFPEEVDLCFPGRTLRVLQAMPKLEVVMTLGWVTAGAVLGRNPEPGVKSHEGQWFGTDLLPNVAIFCLDHPREYGRECEARKRGKLRQYLTFFQTEYARSSTSKIVKILQRRQAERKQAQATYEATE